MGSADLGRNQDTDMAISLVATPAKGRSVRGKEDRLLTAFDTLKGGCADAVRYDE